MDYSNLVDSVFRWIHVVAGILWIGLLYFFNWVNTAFAPTLDADSKKKVVPELLPRTLFWFRWGAAYTWVSGLVLLIKVYYHDSEVMVFGGEGGWAPLGWIGPAIAFLGFMIYDPLFKAVKDPKAQFILGWVLASGAVIVMQKVCGFGFRAYAIHLGAMFGTFMAANVWMRIWPSQKKIITAVKNGEAPDGALVALAGMRSKHNTYMSIPLVFMMLSQQSTWLTAPANISWVYIPAVILIGWLVCYALYQKAKSVPGF